ncbi:exopolyphosphatase, partial [Corynebacterium striatum]
MDSGYFDGAAYDPETVRFFDVAHEGGQVRVLAGEVQQLAQHLGGTQPRSLVILPTEQVARAAAYTAAGLAEPSRVPVVVAESLPQFVGALDVVVVIGERGECDWASR